MRAWFWLALAALAACDSEPAFVRYRKELVLLDRIEVAFGRSIDAEKSSVLAVTDAESEAFAAESRAAAAEVDRDIQELASVVEFDRLPGELAKLAAVQSAWAGLKAVDERLLALAVANTNLKATRLSGHEAARSLDRLVAALQALAATTSDPDRIRELSRASIAALRIQVLQAPHIASADDAEMDRLESRMRDASHEVERTLAELRSEPEAAGSAHIEEAAAAWAEYDRTSAEVIRLSRQNTNVRSFDISVHEKRQATETFRVALAALADEVRSTQTATR
jgi:hypothetical protein